MTIADIRQALFEQLHELETKYAVQFSRGATLYINPTNSFGEDVTPRMPGGHEFRTLYSMGPYRSAQQAAAPLTKGDLLIVAFVSSLWLWAAAFAMTSTALR
jgi:hypothetical protein